MRRNAFYINEFRVEIRSIAWSDHFHEFTSEGLIELWNCEYHWRAFEGGGEWLVELNPPIPPDQINLERMFNDDPDLLWEYLAEWDLARSNVEMFRKEMESAVRAAMASRHTP